MAELLIGKTKNIEITSFFAIKKFIRDEMIKYQGTYVYLPGLIFRCTQDVVNVPTNHHSRLFGKSNYNLVSLASLWINGFTNFSVKPLRLLTLTGFILSFFAFIYSLFVIAKKIESPEVPLGWATIAFFLVMFGGLNMMAIGLVGEYIGRAYLLLNNHPQSVIRKTTKLMKTKHH